MRESGGRFTAGASCRRSWSISGTTISTSFAGKGLDHLWVGRYEADAIRPRALGHFRDLLLATAHSPAMLFYLDNQLNTEPGSPGARGNLTGINENYAREIMELHTLGVDGGYTQNDVIALAHILTGWGLARRDFNRGDGTAQIFDPKGRHDFHCANLSRPDDPARR